MKKNMDTKINTKTLKIEFAKDFQAIGGYNALPENVQLLKEKYTEISEILLNNLWRQNGRN